MSGGENSFLPPRGGGQGGGAAASAAERQLPSIENGVTPFEPQTRLAPHLASPTGGEGKTKPVVLPFTLGKIHHVAYRCRDAKVTADWYARMLGMSFQTAFSEDHVPSTGAYDPYMHIFLDCGGGNVIAFFELPHQPEMGRDPNTPAWVQHIAFQVADFDTLKAAKAHLEGNGVEVLGPTFHGIFRSIYFFDPNGHRLELACDIGTPEQYAELRRVAPLMLDEWSQTKTAPRHADWLHVDPGSLVE